MNNNRSEKLHALMHCITTTLGERSSARQRLAEMGTPACWCGLCRKTFPPQRPPSFEPSDYFQRREENAQYHNSRPQSVEWANNMVSDLRKKYPRSGGGTMCSFLSAPSYNNIPASIRTCASCIINCIKTVSRFRLKAMIKSRCFCSRNRCSDVGSEPTSDYRVLHDAKRTS